MSDPKNCPLCHDKNLNTDDFYIRNGKFDCYCKTCRKAKSIQYQNKNGWSQGKNTSKKMLDLDRSNKRNFLLYMMQNPYYFEYVFHKPNTENNINMAFRGRL